MSKLPHDPLRKGIHSEFYDQAKAQQDAFFLLTRGLVRYQASGELLSAEELAQIGPHRSRLVLNAPERWLFEESSRAIKRQRRRRNQVLLKAAGLVAVALLLLALRPWTPPQAVKSSPAAEQAEPAAVEESPLKTSNLPVAQARREAILQGDSLPSRPQEVKREEPASPLPAPPEEPAEAKPEEQPSPFSMRIPVKTDDGTVYRVRKSGEWGLATADDQVLLPLNYRSIRPLHPGQGLFVIDLNGKKGLADARGNIIIHPFFDSVGEYYAGEHLLVVFNGGKSGVFDVRSQEFALGLIYKSIGAFSEGIFSVRADDGKWGFVNRRGEIMVEPAYDAVLKPFTRGRAQVSKAGQTFYIDLEGDVLAGL